MGGESTIFEFQGNKLLEGATNVDARCSDFNFNNASGDQTIIDRRVYANMAIFIEKVVDEKVIDEKVVEKIIEKILAEKSRSGSVYETIGRCAVATCCTVVVGCTLVKLCSRF